MTAGRPLVLIVDDDVELRTMLREYLADEQFDVEACADGRPRCAGSIVSAPTSCCSTSRCPDRTASRF